MSKTERILVIQTAFLGDLLLSVPLIKNLKKQFPQAEISLVCRRSFVSFMQSLKLLHHCYGIEKNDSASYQTIIEQNIHYDFLFCPHQSFTTARFAKKIKANQRVGFYQWWNGFAFDKRVPRNSDLPDALRQLSLLSSIDPIWQERLKSFEKYDQHYQSGERLKPVPDWASAEIHPQAKSGNSVVIFPGSVWATKQWTEKGFAELGKKLIALGHHVEWLGSHDEKELCERLATQSGGESFAGKLSINESFQRLAQAKLAVCNDSGSQHMAALSGTPTVSIFGPTVLALGYRPWNSNASVVEKTGLSCRPCGKHGHQSCPIGSHECMTAISSDVVLKACRQFL